MTPTNVAELVQPIQYILAPAVMISSSALLLLGFQNKFSALASRFRALNHERRLLEEKEKRSAAEDARLQSVRTQTSHFLGRARFVKNAILSIYSGILCFISTSVLIYLDLFTTLGIHKYGICLFLAGFLFIFIAVIFLIGETLLFHRVVKIEAAS